MGTGASMIWATGVPLLVPIYPEWSGRVTSLIETAAALGTMVGPTSGSIMYSIGGYKLPFLSAAFTEILLGIICIFILPNKHSKRDEKHVADSGFVDIEASKSNCTDLTEQKGFTFIYFASRPVVMLACLPLVCHSVNMGFIDVAGISFTLFPRHHSKNQ